VSGWLFDVMADTMTSTNSLIRFNKNSKSQHPPYSVDFMSSGNSSKFMAKTYCFEQGTEQKLSTWGVSY